MKFEQHSIKYLCPYCKVLWYVFIRVITGLLDKLKYYEAILFTGVTRVYYGVARVY
jgi:hypothetical protein